MPAVARNQPDSSRIIIVLLGILTLVVFAYSAWRIQVNDRRWEEFMSYVQARDVRWEAYSVKTEAGLNAVNDRLGRIEGRK